MAQSKYEDVRDVIAGIVWEEDFKVIDETMAINNLTVTSGDLSKEVMGKKMSDLQEGITFGVDKTKGNVIKGTVKYVEDYTSFGFAPTDHWFLFLKVKTTLKTGVEGAKYKITAGIAEQRELDSDKDMVLNITGKTAQKFTVKLLEGATEVKSIEYDLTELTLEPAPNVESVEEPVTDGQQ